MGRIIKNIVIMSVIFCGALCVEGRLNNPDGPGNPIWHLES